MSFSGPQIWAQCWRIVVRIGVGMVVWWVVGCGLVCVVELLDVFERSCCRFCSLAD